MSLGLCKGGEEDSDDVSTFEKDRKCTDVLFLIFFGAFWVGMFIVAGIGFSDGNTKRLYYGIDYHARLCGDSADDADFSNRTVLHYYNPMKAVENISAGSYPALESLQSICIESCPGNFINYTNLSIMATTGNIDIFNTPEYFYCEYLHYVQKNLNGRWDEYKYLTDVTETTKDKWSVQYFDQLNKEHQAKSLTPGNDGPCQPTFLKYDDMLNVCFPSIPDEDDAKNAIKYNAEPTEASTAPSGTSSDDINVEDLKGWINYLSDSRSRLADYVADIMKAWAVILVCGLLGGVVFSMIWMLVLRYFTGIMAWATIGIVNLMFILTTVMLAQKAGLVGDSAVGTTVDFSEVAGVNDPSEEDKKYFEYATYVSAVFTGLVFLFTLIMAKRVAVAIACLKVASDAINTMPLVLFFPLIPFAFEILLVAYWMLVAATLYSAGDLTEKAEGGYTLEYDDNLRYMMLYHLFGLLWTNQFLVGYGLCVIACAVASYYWTRGDTSKMPSNPVGAAMRLTARYHMGSIALGSFLVAVIQFVRVILEYVDRKTKEVQEENPVLKYLMCCVKYCMWYLENVMKFINRNAYIIVAVKGSAYCSAAMRAISLIISNALRLAAVNMIGDTLTWLGKVSVALLSGFLCFLMTDTKMYTDTSSTYYLSSPLLPILLSILISYFIATCFFMVYDMAVDTILLSFCEDCMQNDENPKFAPPLLAEAIGMKPGKNTVAAEDR